jgi:hypothetical protein
LHRQLRPLSLAGHAIGHGDIPRRIDLGPVLRLGDDGQRGDQGGGDGVVSSNGVQCGVMKMAKE